MDGSFSCLSFIEVSSSNKGFYFMHKSSKWNWFLQSGERNEGYKASWDHKGMVIKVQIKMP